MIKTLTINAADTIENNYFTDSKTAKTFLTDWVRPKEIIDRPVYRMYAGMVSLGDTADNLRQLKAGCCEALFKAYALKTGLNMKKLYDSPGFAAAISHYAGIKNLYPLLLNSDEYDPLDRFFLKDNNRSLLLAEVLYSLTSEFIEENRDTVFQ